MIFPDTTCVIFSPVIFSVLPPEFTVKLSCLPTVKDLSLVIDSVCAPLVVILTLDLLVVLTLPSVILVLAPPTASVLLAEVYWYVFPEVDVVELLKLCTLTLLFVTTNLSPSVVSVIFPWT